VIEYATDSIAPECHLLGTPYLDEPVLSESRRASFIHPFALAGNRTCVRL